METIPLRDLVHNSVTYCARISRHFLVWLISEHVQELWQLGDGTYISTDIGQFMLYTHEGRSLVHFDGSIRTSTETVVPDQALEDIRNVANQEYKGETTTWKKVPIHDFATVSTPLPFVVHYLRTKDIEEWRLLRIFAGVIGEVVQSIVRAAASPASFVAAFKIDWSTSWSEPSAMDTPGSATVSEQLASSMQLVIRSLRTISDSCDIIKGRSR